MPGFDVSAVGYVYRLMDTKIKREYINNDVVAFGIKHAIQESSVFILSTVVSALFTKTFLVPTAVISLTYILSRVFIVRYEEYRRDYFIKIKKVVRKAKKVEPLVKISLVASSVLMFLVNPVYSIGLSILTGFYYAVGNSIIKRDLSKNVSIFKIFNDEFKLAFNQNPIVKLVKKVAGFIANPFSVFRSSSLF